MVIKAKLPEPKVREKKKCPNTPCPTCETWGILQRNEEFREPYGYPYRPPVIDCPDCKGMGWVYR